MKLQIELTELEYVSLWEEIRHSENKVINRLAHQMYLDWQKIKENKKNIVNALENTLF
jgi:hypothetical protein